MHFEVKFSFITNQVKSASWKISEAIRRHGGIVLTARDDVIVFAPNLWRFNSPIQQLPPQISLGIIDIVEDSCSVQFHRLACIPCSVAMVAGHLVANHTSLLFGSFYRRKATVGAGFTLSRVCSYCRCTTRQSYSRVTGWRKFSGKMPSPRTLSKQKSLDKLGSCGQSEYGYAGVGGWAMCGSRLSVVRSYPTSLLLSVVSIAGITPCTQLS